MAKEIGCQVLFAQESLFVELLHTSPVNLGTKPTNMPTPQSQHVTLYNSMDHKYKQNYAEIG